MTIRLLQEPDAERYLELRREALLDSPLAFTASPDDDLVSSVEVFRERIQDGPETVIFGAFEPRLVGVVGLYREHHAKASHKAHLWGMYVSSGHRGRGFASELLQAALRHASTLPGIVQVQLSVSSAAPEARRLYERAGFRVWGTEPDSLRYDGQTVVDHHMALFLPVEPSDAG